MPELIKALGSFFSRDLLYIGAGSLIVIAFLLGVCGNKMPELPEYALFPVAFVSYIAGYFFQELFAIAKLVSVRDVSKPGIAFNFFNKRSALEDVSQLENANEKSLTDWKHYYWSNKKQFDERFSAQIERFLTLRQIATTFGPSLIISPVVYVLASISASEFHWPFLLVVLISVLAGLFLCAQSHYRSTQVAVTLSKEIPGRMQRQLSCS